jgi:hypothetical protein
MSLKQFNVWLSRVCSYSLLQQMPACFFCLCTALRSCCPDSHVIFSVILVLASCRIHATTATVLQAVYTVVITLQFAWKYSHSLHLISPRCTTLIQKAILRSYALSANCVVLSLDSKFMWTAHPTLTSSQVLPLGRML